MLADKTNRTRFKTRFQVSGNERCYVEPSAFFPSFTIVFFLFLSTAIWPFTDYKEPSSLSLFLRRWKSKRRVTAYHIIMQFTINRCYRDEFRHSCSRDLNFLSKRRNKNFQCISHKDLLFMHIIVQERLSFS